MAPAFDRVFRNNRPQETFLESVLVTIQYSDEDPGWRYAALFCSGLQGVGAEARRRHPAALVPV